MSSAYRILVCIDSIPLSAMLANKGLTTPPCGVPCSGNSRFIPALRHRNIPNLSDAGAINLSMIVLWEIRSKHFLMSNSITRFKYPL